MALTPTCRVENKIKIHRIQDAINQKLSLDASSLTLHISQKSIELRTMAKLYFKLSRNKLAATSIGKTMIGDDSGESRVGIGSTFNLRRIFPVRDYSDECRFD